LRLRAAEANLARLDDVINQLAGQVEALKRQAKQAVRYRVVAEQVRKAEATLFHLRWVAANRENAEAGHAKDIAVRVVLRAPASRPRRPRARPTPPPSLRLCASARSAPRPPCSES